MIFLAEVPATPANSLSSAQKWECGLQSSAIPEVQRKTISNSAEIPQMP